MTEERTSYNINGQDINLTPGRSWHRADEAGDLTPWPDGDDFTWDDDALDYEAKLLAAERTIAELRAALETRGGMAVAVCAAFGAAGVVMGFIARGWLP